MKNDEFAFLNQQLAAMLRDGIPLEGALRRLCAEMKAGALRGELEKLASDLAQGTPLAEAARARQLPELYRRMLEVGARSNNLPGVLTLMADYFQRRHLIWTRLKGLMVYPAIVLVGSFLLSCFLSVTLSNTVGSVGSAFHSWGRESAFPIDFWLPPILLGLAVLILFTALAAAPVRRVLRWRFPAFKEASLAQVAAALTMMLKNGVPLDQALGLAEQLERGTPAESELARWRQRLAAGQGKFSDMAAGGNFFPPLFVWMVTHAGEDLAAGFDRAWELYRARADYRTELLLYSAMPCAMLGLGVVIVSQIQPAVAMLVELINSLVQVGP